MATASNDADKKSKSNEEEEFDSWPDFMYTSKSLDMWDKELPPPAPISVHTAASLGDLPYVESLIKSGKVSYEELCRPNRSGWTPLMYACSRQHEYMVKLLLDAGVDVNRPGKKGLTALMVSAKGCDQMILWMLLNRARADFNACDDNGWTALFHAVHMEQEHSMEWLISHGANVNAIEPSTGRTILMLAAESARISVVETLLRYGADPYAISRSEQTALSIATNSQNHPVAELLQRIVSRRKPNNLRHLLVSIGYQKYWPLFRDQHVDLELFLSLSEGDLKMMGVDKVGPRKTMAEAIDKWRTTK